MRPATEALWTVLAGRLSVRLAVRQHPRVAYLRQYFPAVTAPNQVAWRTLFTGELTRRLRETTQALMPSWAQFWAAAPQPNLPQPTDGDGEPEPVDARELTAADLVRMMSSGEQFVVHRTDRENVGTLKAAFVEARPPLGREDSNAPTGVYLMKGVSGADTGRFGIVWKLENLPATPVQMQMNGEWYVPINVPTDSAEGYYRRETLNLANQQRGR